MSMPNSTMDFDSTIEYCPVVLAAELVTERWNLLIVREVLMGAARFTEIHDGLPGLSRTVLSQRLRRLQRSGVIARKADGGYRMTAAGRDLRPVLLAIGRWGARWCFPKPSSEKLLEPYQFARQMQAGLLVHALPPQKVVVQLIVEDPAHGPKYAWLILNGENSTACSRDPLFEVDLYAVASSRTWNEVWFGFRSFESALRDEAIQLTGNRSLVREFRSWFRLSAFAPEIASSQLAV